MMFVCHSEERSDEESRGMFKLRFFALLRMTTAVKFRFFAASALERSEGLRMTVVCPLIIETSAVKMYPIYRNKWKLEV
jgi:short-subunit dehydrogenase